LPDWLQADELPNGGERMPETKLKPCPFCGGKAYYRTPTHLKGTAFDVMTVECKQCGASPYAVEVYENDTEENKRKTIAEFWNRRADAK
jgi:restriction alleviation protein, lar family